MKSKDFEAPGIDCPADSDYQVQVSSHTNCVEGSSVSLRFASRLGRLKCSILALSLLTLCSLLACGPFFPNNLLDGGDQAVLVAPLANFGRELQRMGLMESRFQAVTLDVDGKHSTHLNQSSDAELADLVAALKRARLADGEAEKIRDAQEAERKKLKDYVAAFERWKHAGEGILDGHGRHWEKPSAPPPDFPALNFVAGLPAEFSDYFEGAMAWYNPALTDKGFARQAWVRLLARPADERKFKSTWAAFMLGKSFEEENPDKAIQHFKQVRELSARGFADSVGLAAASLGLEARVEFKRRNLKRAVQLYLEQFATGDTSALDSLRIVASSALSSERSTSLEHLAADAKAQRVITAYLISRRASALDLRRTQDDAVKRWLEAVEAANVLDVNSTEQLALAAYQAGEMDQAQRWINRSQSSPVSQWLQAKLLLRSGKVEQAAGLLAKVIRRFPFEPPGTNSPATFADNLSVEINPEYRDRITSGRQAFGELGVLRLARREYAQALDSLLRSGYWMDAAFVAERVLSADELKAYVDRSWPNVPNDERQEPAANENEETHPAMLRQKVRYLLARRLMRLNRAEEAGDYFPPQWQLQFGALMQSLRNGWDETQASEQRARSLFTAAIIARTNGLELYGTEVGPDWRIHGGNFAEGVTAQGRTNESFQILSASTDELRRSATHHPEPEKRFHYRYQAASLAWEAAKLLPDNSDETARVLCTAGSWLKRRDPKTADFFYKALVRRCRKTAIGKQADQMRWFPVLDEQGNPKPYRLRLAAVEPPEQKKTQSVNFLSDDDEVLREYPVPGKFYIIRQGDELRDIATAVQRLGYSLTVEEIIAANPGLKASELHVGQKIFIPELND